MPGPGFRCFVGGGLPDFWTPQSLCSEPCRCVSCDRRCCGGLRTCDIPWPHPGEQHICQPCAESRAEREGGDEHGSSASRGLGPLPRAVRAPPAVQRLPRSQTPPVQSPQTVPMAPSQPASSSSKGLEKEEERSSTGLEVWVSEVIASAREPSPDAQPRGVDTGPSESTPRGKGKRSPAPTPCDTDTGSSESGSMGVRLPPPPPPPPCEKGTGSSESGNKRWRRRRRSSAEGSTPAAAAGDEEAAVSESESSKGATEIPSPGTALPEKGRPHACSDCGFFFRKSEVCIMLE